MKSIVQDLYNLIVQAYDHKGTQTEAAMREQMCVPGSVDELAAQAH